MARDFSGTNQFLDRAGAVVTAVPLTIACWFNADDVTDASALVALSSGATTNEFQLRMSAASKVIARVNGTGVDAATSTTTSNGAWTHGCAVFAANNSRSAYLNGGGKVTDTGSATPSGVNSTDVATDGGGGDDFNGRLAEIGIWNVALTDAEVAVLADGYCPLFIRPNSLVAYYPLIGRMSPEIDLIGGNGLTVTDATQSAHPRIIYPAPQVVIHAPAAVVGGDAVPVCWMQYRARRVA